MKFAVIENGVVTNLVRANVEFASKYPNWVAAFETTDIGDLWDGTVFSKPVPTQAQLRRRLKRTIRELLRRTDWTQVPDNLGPAKRTAWATWRTQLRDLLALPDLNTAVIPEAPGDLDEDGL